MLTGSAQASELDSGFKHPAPALLFQQGVLLIIVPMPMFDLTFWPRWIQPTVAVRTSAASRGLTA